MEGPLAIETEFNLQPLPLPLRSGSKFQPSSYMAGVSLTISPHAEAPRDPLRVTSLTSTQGKVERGFSRTMKDVVLTLLVEEIPSVFGRSGSGSRDQIDTYCITVSQNPISFSYRT